MFGISLTFFIVYSCCWMPRISTAPLAFRWGPRGQRHSLPNEDARMYYQGMGSVLQGPKTNLSSKLLQLTCNNQSLQDAPGWISYMVDIWSTKARYPYLAITAHWIHRDKSTNGLQLCSTLIAFHHLWGSHNGARLARITLHLFDWVGVTVKVRLSFTFLPFSALCLHAQGGHWTLNNALLNNAFLKELEILLRPCEVEFDHKDNHIRCFPHVTNICSNHVIKASTNISLEDDTGGFITSASQPPSAPDNQTYEEAVARDPITLCWSTVRAVRASGQWPDHLAEVIENGNKKRWFKSAKKPNVTIQVEQAQLVCDMKDRWDSLYFMINSFRKLCLVCLNSIIL